MHGNTNSLHGSTNIFHGKTNNLNSNKNYCHGNKSDFHGNTNDFHGNTNDFRDNTNILHNNTNNFHGYQTEVKDDETIDFYLQSIETDDFDDFDESAFSNKNQKQTVSFSYFLKIQDFLFISSVFILKNSQLWTQLKKIIHYIS